MGRIIEFRAGLPPLSSTPFTPEDFEVMWRLTSQDQKRLVGSFSVNSVIAARVEQELVDIGLLVPSSAPDAPGPSTCFGWVAYGSIEDMRAKLRRSGGSALTFTPVEVVEDALDEAEWLGGDLVVRWL